MKIQNFLKTLTANTSTVAIYFLPSTCDKYDKRYSFKNIEHHHFSALYWPQTGPKKRCKDGGLGHPLNLHGPLVHHAIRRRRPPRSMITRLRSMHRGFFVQKRYVYFRNIRLIIKRKSVSINVQL